MRETITEVIKTAMRTGERPEALEAFLRFVADAADWERLDSSARHWMLASADTSLGVESGAFDSSLPDAGEPAAIKAPIQLLVSADSQPAFAQAADRLAGRLGSEVTRIPGTHFPYLDHPDELAETVRRFLHRISGCREETAVGAAQDRAS